MKAGHLAHARHSVDDLGAGLATLERALGGVAFEPRTATASFRAATTDFGARLIMPRLLAQLDAEAPGVQVQIRPLPLDTEDALASGDVDLMIGVYTGRRAGSTACSPSKGTLAGSP